MKKNELGLGEKYEENFRISKDELKELFKKIDIRLFANRLHVEGQNVVIPPDKELNCKVKYDVDENYSIAVKISWKNDEFEPVSENEDVNF